MSKKICFIGSDGVGKTSIIRRKIKNVFSNSYLPTLGVDFYKWKMNETLFDSNIVKPKKTQMENSDNEDDKICMLWDIASQKHFMQMRKHYMAYSSLYVIVVDINRTDPKYIVPWIEDVKNIGQPKAKSLILINKTDLVEDKTEIDRISQLLKETYAPKDVYDVFVTSAKTGDNIHEVFNSIAKTLFE